MQININRLIAIIKFKLLKEIRKFISHFYLITSIIAITEILYFLFIVFKLLFVISYIYLSYKQKKR